MESDGAHMSRVWCGVRDAGAARRAHPVDAPDVKPLGRVVVLDGVSAPDVGHGPVDLHGHPNLHVHLLGSADFTSWGARATIERPAPWGLQLDLISRASRFGDHCSIH